MFASKIQKQVTFPDGHVTIRKLSARSLEKAAEQRQIAIAQFTTQMGAEVFKMFSGGAKDESEPKKELTTEEQRKQRYTLYDREAVLRAGVVSWTFDVKLDAGLGDLEEEAAQKLHEAILDLSLPALTDKEREEASAKDFGLSINS